MTIRFAVLFLAALCVQCHFATRSDAFQSSIPNYKKTTNRNFELQVHRLGDQRNVEVVYLDDQIQGQRVDLNIRLMNHTNLPITDIVAKSQNAGFVSKIQGENRVAPGESLELDIKLTPNRYELRDGVDILTIDKAKSEENGSPHYIFLGSIFIHAESRPPLQPESHNVEFTNEQPFCTVKVLRASSKVKVTDPSKFALNSRQLEIKGVEEKEDHYAVKIGLRDEASVPKQDFSATLFAPFNFGSGPDLMMNEELTFIPNPRFEVKPENEFLAKQPRISLQIDRQDRENATGFKLYNNGNTIVRNLTASKQFEAILVAERDGRPHLLDPDIVNPYATTRNRNPSEFTVSLVANVYSKSAQEMKLYIVFYGDRSYPDLDTTWEEFAAKNKPIPVAIEP